MAPLPRNVDSALVDEDVADPLEMGEYGDARFRLDAADQALAAARDDHVDGAVEAGQHQANRGSVAARHQLDRGFRQTSGAQPCGQAGMDRAR